MSQHCRGDKNKMLTLHTWNSNKLLTVQNSTPELFYNHLNPQVICLQAMLEINLSSSVGSTLPTLPVTSFTATWTKTEASSIPSKYTWRYPAQTHHRKRANSSQTSRSKDGLSPALKWPWTFFFYICIMALGGNKNYWESLGCAPLLE